jgi:ATPase subunit of ABC transporter with duplicated ATPase domains
MLQAFGLSFEPSPLVGPLFQNLHFSLDQGDKVALIGSNGCGKTKLLEILAGRIAPGAGRAVLSRGARIAYLPQDFDLAFDGTLREFFFCAAGVPLPHDVEAYLDAGGPAFEAKFLRSAASLGISEAMLDRHYNVLSLGERMRAALTLLLIDDPTVLLLDEPTNHLDLEAREWLEDFLVRCRQAVLMVCHDRAMINAVADRTLAFEGGGLVEYAGGYDDLVEARAQRQASQMEAWQKQKAETRRLKIATERTLQKAASMTKRPTSRTYDPAGKAFYAGKQAKLDRRAKAILSRVSQHQSDAAEKPFVADGVKLAFSSAPLRSDFALEVRGLCVAVEGRVLADRVDFSLERQGRMAVVGPNGCGKTTLFRALLGERPCPRGTIDWAPTAKPAYLSQTRGTLDYTLPVLEALGVRGGAHEELARTLLGRLRMRGDNVLKPVGVLSVGERTKAELVKILLSPANVLLLDEPTNHLDIESLEALETALEEFPGTVLFTSHDRAFVERVASEVIELPSS